MTTLQELMNETSEERGIDSINMNTMELLIINKYIEKEKQMIINAWNDGFSMLSDLKDNQSAEQYYNEIFKQTT